MSKARIGVVVAAAVVAVVAAVTVVVVAAQGTTAAGPPWSGRLSDCRSNPTAHVHDPSRLEFLKSCSTVSGRVKSVRFVAAFDDLKITIIPDDATRSFLPKANGDLLVADVIATDQANVTAPPTGSHVVVWGAWALDKASKTVTLIPAYRIVVNQAGNVVRGRSTEKHGPPVNRELKLSLQTQRRVAVGGSIDVTIRARWLQGGRLIPAPQIRLFTEMTTLDGEGVRWKATMTDTRGVANIELVTIQVPAEYSFTVYTAPSKLSVTARAMIHVAKN